MITGGCVARGRPNDKGYFIEPTIAGSVNSRMRVFREEIFGPFMVLVKFSDEATVLEMANDTEYGLGSAVFTQDIARAMRFVGQIQAGMVWINSSNNSDFRVPFGGVKQSGIGKELGQAGLDAYSHIKAVHLNLVMGS
jgi:aldehyde dehydrogenase (NAD+)